jgi:putative FmdB family regulatory protein
MPIYEYVCKKCGKQFEELVRVSGKPIRVACPACGAKKTERVMSACAIGASCGTAPAAT